MVRSIPDACIHLSSNYPTTTALYLFGLPQTIVTDNGPCFSSEEFTLFLKNGILHLKSAPYHPSSNGLAERAIQTFKQGMKKFTDGDLRDRLSCFLAHYRTTPHTTTGVCPAELLGQRPHTTLDLLRPSVSTRFDHKQLQQKQAHDDEAQVRNFSVGERIYTWQYGRGAKNWVPGQIIEHMGSLLFLVELNNGTVCQRHQDQIHKWHDPVDTAPMPTMVEPPDQDTSVPPATATLPELPRSDELSSLSHRGLTPQNILIHKLLWLKRLQQPCVTQQETDGHLIV